MYWIKGDKTNSTAPDVFVMGVPKQPLRRIWKLWEEGEGYVKEGITEPGAGNFLYIFPAPEPPTQRVFQRTSKSSVEFLSSTCKVQVPGITFKSPESRANSALSDSAVNTAVPFGSRNVHTEPPDLI